MIITKEILSEEDCSFICNHYYDMTAKQISEIIGCSRNKVSNTLIKYGYKGKQKRRYPISHQDYFSQINTPAKAYFLGFIAADGCIYKRKNCNQQGILRFCIAKEDEEILIQFKQELGAEIPLHYSRGKYVTLEICCEEIYKDITALGLHERKTYGNSIPTDIPDHLFKYFIKGYFDGDGSITKNKEANINQININISGYKNNLQKITDYLHTKNIVMPFMPDRRLYSDGNGIFGRIVATNTIIKYSFLKYLYDDDSCPCLKRKKDLALNFINKVDEDKSIMKIITQIYYDYAVRNID